MLKVLSHGKEIVGRNASTGLPQTMILVTLTEDRPDTSFSPGEAPMRVHIHPVDKRAISQFAVGKAIAGYINRKLYSSPQNTAQRGQRPRMLNGKPTYIVTYIDSNLIRDLDYRNGDNDNGIGNVVNSLQTKVVAIEQKPAPKLEPKLSKNKRRKQIRYGIKP